MRERTVEFHHRDNEMFSWYSKQPSESDFCSYVLLRVAASSVNNSRRKLRIHCETLLVIMEL